MKSPPRYSDIAIEKGIVMKSARKAVVIVPVTNGRAPYFSKTGSHTLPVKKLKPNSLIDGIEFRTSDTKIAMVINRTNRPDKKMIFVNKRSGTIPVTCAEYLIPDGVVVL